MPAQTRQPARSSHVSAEVGARTTLAVGRPVVLILGFAYHEVWGRPTPTTNFCKPKLGIPHLGLLSRWSLVSAALGWLSVSG